VIFGAPAINGETVYIDEFRALDEEQALFGSVTFAITPALKATAGVRASRTSFEFTEAKDGPAAGGPSTSDGKQKESPVNPKVSLSYQMNDDNLLYVSAARGYRVGGANAPIPTYDACTQALASLGMTHAPLEYDSDSTWSYEMGSKNRLAGGRLQIDASVYYIEWQDIISAIPSLPGCPFSFTSNLGTAQSKGFDLQVQWQALNSLLLGASVGYNSAEYLDTILPGGATQPLVTEGHTLGSVPWTLVGTVEYHFAGPWSSDAYARAIEVYRSEDNRRRSFNDPQDDAYDPEIPNPGSASNLELRVGASFGDGWDVSTFVDNALNRQNIQAYSRDAVGAMVFSFVPARPRTFGLTLSRNF
jgi:iron complex outermembrane recepter protein